MKKKTIKQFFHTPLKEHWHNFVLKIKPYLTWRMLICFIPAWMITNGWSYVFVAVGASAKIGWMWKIGVVYQGILWMPWTAEKVVTVAIAVVLYKWWFHTTPNIPREEMNHGKRKKGETALMVEKSSEK